MKKLINRMAGWFVISLLFNVFLLSYVRIMNYDYDDMQDMAWTAEVNLEIEKNRVEYYIKKLDEPLISEIVFHARDPKTKDFFTFLKMNGRGKTGYQIISDIKPIDRLQFDLIYDVLIDSMADLHFAMENLWGESRVGANQKHSRNSDGSIDFGWFGKNYPKGTNPLKVSVIQQARDYCKHVNENNLMGYPPEQRRSRYYSKYYWEKDRMK